MSVAGCGADNMPDPHPGGAPIHLLPLLKKKKKTYLSRSFADRKKKRQIRPLENILKSHFRNFRPSDCQKFKQADTDGFRLAAKQPLESDADLDENQSPIDDKVPWESFAEGPDFHGQVLGPFGRGALFAHARFGA